MKEKYDQSVKDKNIAIHYSTEKTENGTVLRMAVQNIGNVYMKNLTINYDDCCQSIHKGPGTYNYKNLGNLKNRSNKTMTLNIASKDVESVKLNYSFTPVQEDSFLTANEASAAQMEPETINNNLILYIGK